MITIPFDKYANLEAWFGSGGLIKMALLEGPELFLQVAAAIRPGNGEGCLSSKTSSSNVKSGLLQPPLEPQAPLLIVP